MLAASRDEVLIVDNSDHRRAGSWFADCLAGFAAATVVAREDLDVRGARWRAAILAGSERSIFENVAWLERQCSFVRNVLDEGMPLLGVCFGHQLIFRALYGKDALARRQVPEVGWGPVELAPCGLFAGVPSTVRPYNFHFDEVAELPAGWRLRASSPSCRVHAVSHDELPVWGLQFHPEVTPDEGAASILRSAPALAGCGLDAASITSGGARVAGYYPEIIHNFIASCGR
jgi:GMP synthase-like glutamine amidotransferase